MATQKIILWAIDPFEQQTPVSQAAVIGLMNWAKASALEIQPVHVLRVPEFLPASGVADGMGSYLENVEVAIGQFLKARGFETKLPSKILVEGSSSASDAVRKVCEYASENGAQGIVVSSHGRRGLERMVLGSFAENLLSSAQCPVYFLPQNEQQQEADRFRRALFPTDFSKFSKRAFSEFLKTASKLHLDVTLYFSVCLPTEVFSVGSGAPLVIPEDFFEEQIRLAGIEGAHWVDLAKNLGVRVELVIQDEGYNSNVSELILNAAKKAQADLIAMASVSGPFKSFVAGSVARSVFRKRSYPVLVYGPKAVESLSSAS